MWGPLIKLCTSSITYVFNVLKFDDEPYSCCHMDILDMIVIDTFRFNYPHDLLEACLVHSKEKPFKSEKIEECVQQLKNLPL